MGHLKCNHGVWLTIAHVLAGGTRSLLPAIAGAVEENLMRWLRAAELTCDRAALLVAQDKLVVIGALMKLAGGSPSFNQELSIEAFMRQVGPVLLSCMHTACVRDVPSMHGDTDRCTGLSCKHALILLLYQSQVAWT